MSSVLPALLKMKCPCCREGNVFKVSNPFRLKYLGDMNDLCPVCQLNLRPEPGFYFGGAVISYPLMVIFNLIVTIIFYLIVGDLFNHFIALMTTFAIASILIAPVAFRYSRIIFLYIVVRFEKKS